MSNPSRALSPQLPAPSLYACLYMPPSNDAVAGAEQLVQIAEQFSPRYEVHGGERITIDICGLDRLFGSPWTIGEELRREAADRGLRPHVAVAHTRMTALILARARPGLTVVAKGDEATALAPISIGIIASLEHEQQRLRPCEQEDASGPDLNLAPFVSASVRGGGGAPPPVQKKIDAVEVVAHWGIRTLGEFAALPAADVVARLGRHGAVWQSMARGEDLWPLVPTRADERFDASVDLEWPIEGLEPLSFVLTRMLEPLSVRLEQRDRGAAVLHLSLRLATRPVSVYVRRLELPSPMRDVKTLRTLALLDLEAHPPDGAIEQVSITIDPIPGRVLQHTLFTRPHPTPEQLSTLLARLNALMGQDRLGAPAVVDSFRPGAFAMKPFAIAHEHQPQSTQRTQNIFVLKHSANPANTAVDVVSALRRCRHPVPARVVIDRDGQPVRVTTDRRGFAGGAVLSSAGPWRSSGNWWEVSPKLEERRRRAPGPVQEMISVGKAGPWDRDEWDVALGDGAVYRIYHDRSGDGWFIEGIYD